MQLYPEDIQHLLEFDKVLDLLASYCVGEPAVERVAGLKFYNNPSKIVEVLTEIEEFKNSLEQRNHLSIYAYETVEDDLRYLRKEGYVLDKEAIFRIHTVISICANLKQQLTAEFKQLFPSLTKITLQIEIDKRLSELVSKIFDEEGKVRPDASPELASIHKKIRSKEREIASLFADRLKAFKKSGYLTENNETIKNGRRVLSVSAENKRRIGGIIHDESASGKTVYIEPEELVFSNNQLFELELKKKQEIYKIIKVLCDDLRPYAEDIALWQKIIIRLDLIQAKAKFSLTYNGQKPAVEKEPVIDLVGAFHPLLFIKNSGLNLPTVPFDLVLNKENKMLLISGPNAGGKSITLKSIGLIVMMLHAGMLVPLDARSRLGVFHSIFTDIGDSQSVEDDLSTYSGHLKRMKDTLDNINRRSLILIDEFGSGTDPKIGGAIAESFLDAFKKKSAFGVITTHYSNLKMYAHKTRGILNAAMRFDKKELKPAYQLMVGKPGSSFAFEIAKKTGLNDAILGYARKRTGEDNNAIDKLLVDLVAEKKELEGKMSKILNKEDALKRLIKNYERMHGELELRRKKIKLQSKENELYSTADADKEVQKVIKEIRENQDLESAKKLSNSLREKKKVIGSDITPIKEEIYYAKKIDTKDFKAGDFVRLRSGGSIAEIRSIKKNKAELIMGSMQMTVKLDELIPAGQPITRNPRKSIQKDLVKSATALETKLDIRGYLKKDAEETVQEFMDNALISNANRLEIVHGIGSGALRKAVARKLREYADVRKVYHPEEQYGGEGITIVEF